MNGIRHQRRHHADTVGGCVHGGDFIRISFQQFTDKPPAACGGLKHSLSGQISQHGDEAEGQRLRRLEKLMGDNCAWRGSIFFTLCKALESLAVGCEAIGDALNALAQGHKAGHVRG